MKSIVVKAGLFIVGAAIVSLLPFTPVVAGQPNKRMQYLRAGARVSGARRGLGSDGVTRW